MSKEYYVPLIGSSPSLTTTFLESSEEPMELRVKTHAMYRRFVIEIEDDGLDTFGIQTGDYLIFREQRWPTHEGQICLITLGDDTTIRLLEYIRNPMVTLRVAADKIPELELATTDFCVIGVLDGIVKRDLAEFAASSESAYSEEREYDWGI